MRNIILSCLCFFSFPLLVNAQSKQINWSMEESVSSSGSSPLRPRIVLAGQGPAVIWGIAPDSMLISVQQGNVFLPPINPHPGGLSPWAASWAGGDISAHGDTLITVFSTGTQGIGALYASRSVDGGITWADTVRIGPQANLEARFPTVTYISGQGPAIQFMEFNANWSDPRYVVSTSFDGGDTYTLPIPVSAPHAPDEVCDCCTGQIVSDNDRVSALFRNNDANLRVMWAANSNDGGASFPYGAEIDETFWTSNICSSSGPDGYITGDSIRYVWMSGAQNGTKVYLGSAAFNDLSVGNNRLIHPDQSITTIQNFPRIAGNGDTLGIVWEQFYQGQREILFSYSTTGIAGLSEPDTVNADLVGSQLVPDIAFANGVFHIVWQDQSDGTIRYRKGAIENTIGIDESVRSQKILTWPNPVGNILHINAPKTCSQIQIMNANGGLVKQMDQWNSIDTSALESGSYLLVFLNENGQRIGLTKFVK